MSARCMKTPLNANAAAGQTISYTTKNGASPIDTMHYVLDAAGNIMAVYRNKKIEEQPIYGNTRIGEYAGKEKEGYQTFNLRKYELTNHLGNVLAVISDKVNLYGHNNTLDSARATIVSASDYYPFGLAMQGRTYQDSVCRYGFNGKRKDNRYRRIAKYNYGFRIYSPEDGVFLSVDPLTKSFAYYSPYQFAGNRPIWALDFDGLEDEWYMNVWGKVKYGTGKTVEKANHALENMVNSITVVGTGVIMPVINQGYIISQEGTHPGGPYNRSNKVDWAVPYSIKNRKLVPNAKLMEDYIPPEEGKKILGATVDVVSMAIPIKSPIKVNGKAAQKAINTITGFIVKTPIKRALKELINQAGNTTPEDKKKDKAPK